MSSSARVPDAREVARRVLRRVVTDQAFTSLALDAELNRAELVERERNLATELCYGVCRHMSRLDRAITSAASRGRVKVKPAVRAALRVGAYQLLFLDRVPAHAAVDDAVNAARRAGGKQVGGFANSLLRRLARDGEPALPSSENPVAYVSAAHSLPEWITERLATSLGRGDELLAGADAYNRRAPLAIRVNRERVDVAELASILQSEKPTASVVCSEYCPDALLAIGLGDPQRSPSFTRGLWTVQDVGAQLITRFLGDLPESPENSPEGALTVLDACAGVGGKTLHLAERFGARPGVRIDAADVSASKLERLMDAARRLGVAERIYTIVTDLASPTPDADSVISSVGDPAMDESRTLAEHYDLVLLDAPCTGLGVLRRHPELKWRLRANDVERIAETQRALLDQVCQRVGPGGVLVYSVCTFTYEEGPGQIRRFLAEHPEFELQAPEQTGESADGGAIVWSALTCALTARAPASPGTLSTWPHRHESDGFFAARLRRRATSS